MKRGIAKNRVLAFGVIAGLLLTGCQSDAGSSAETEALKEQIARLEQQISDLEQQQSAAGSDSASNSGLPAADGDSVQRQAGGESGGGAQTSADAGSEGSQPKVSDTGVGNSQQSQSDTGSEEDQQSKNDTSVGNDRQPDADTGYNTQVPHNGNSHTSRHDEEYYHNQSHYAGDSSVTDQQGVSIDGMTTYTMDELGAMVDAFVEKVCAASPGGTAAQDMEQFFALKQEGKQIDDTLDSHEDELEYLYHTGSLTRQEYKQQEQKLELLEDQLDDIEDQLKSVFGIDD